ncbi:MAG: cell division protein FtsW [Phycisphaerae bacterium]|nr:cell division protein FtsW [Phycisphaerae bacterium]
MFSKRTPEQRPERFWRRNPYAFTPTFILAVTATLMGLGVVMVFSAGATLDGQAITFPLWECRSVRQLVFVVAGFLAAVVASTLPYRWYRIRDRIDGYRWLQPNLLLALVTLALLGLVLVKGIGVERNGSQRWLAIGGQTVQPSELAKLTIVLFIAGWYGRRRVDPGKFFTGLMPPVIVIAGFVGLVGLEDFGTAALLLVVGGLMLLVAGSRLWHLLLLGFPAVVAMGAMIYAKPYRMNRLIDFQHIWDDPGGKGYQAVQSLCSIGSGGWWGAGLGAGLQKYGYLPEARTDFIFSIICEELGIAGGLVVIGLFMLFVWQGRKAAEAAPDMFGRLLALGVTLMIGLQAAMNIAVVTVSVPTKGIALPLISAGGSGALFLGVSIGLLASVGRAGSAWRDWMQVRQGLLTGLVEPVPLSEFSPTSDMMVPGHA